MEDGAHFWSEVQCRLVSCGPVASVEAVGHLADSTRFLEKNQTVMCFPPYFCDVDVFTIKHAYSKQILRCHKQSSPD